VGRRARNTNRQGANFELAIMADLTRYGYIAHRSSGSHGAVDVVAVGDMVTLVIQAKITAQVIPPYERRAVIGLAARMGSAAVPMSAYRDRGKVRYRVISGPGPKDFIDWTPAPLRYALCAAPGCEHMRAVHDDACWSRDGCACGAFVLAR